MSFSRYKTRQDVIGQRIYPLMEEAYRVIHEHPALAGLRIRQSLEEMGRFRGWSKHGYPLRDDMEGYDIHRRAHSIYQRISGVLHIETIDPLDFAQVKRTVRYQLRKFHELLQILYPISGNSYVPPRQQEDGSDYEDIQEEIDAFDDRISGENDLLVQISDADYSKEWDRLCKLIRNDNGLQRWQKELLRFELDLVQVNRDLQKMQFQNDLSESIQNRIGLLLSSGRPEVLNDVFEFYRRRHLSAINDFVFEQSYEELKLLMLQLTQRTPSQVGNQTLEGYRNPLLGKMRSAFGRLVAIRAHCYEAADELSQAENLFKQAKEDLVDPEDIREQTLLYVHCLLERRVLSAGDLPPELTSILAALDRLIERYLSNIDTESLVRIDKVIACRLKAAFVCNEKLPYIHKLGKKLSSELTNGDVLHNPWEQIAGYLLLLIPSNMPRKIRAMLRKCAAIPAESENSLLGLVARTYILERKYRSKGGVSSADKLAYIDSLPEDAKMWWSDYDMGRRFDALCDKNKHGSPLLILPFDLK